MTDAPPLVCSFGEPWIGPHPRCDAEAERLEAAFWREVAAGRWDAEGYTPSERRQAEAKRLQAGRLFL